MKLSLWHAKRQFYSLGIFCCLYCSHTVHRYCSCIFLHLNPLLLVVSKKDCCVNLTCFTKIGIGKFMYSLNNYLCMRVCVHAFVRAMPQQPLTKQSHQLLTVTEGIHRGIQAPQGCKSEGGDCLCECSHESCLRGKH